MQRNTLVSLVFILRLVNVLIPFSMIKYIRIHKYKVAFVVFVVTRNLKLHPLNMHTCTYISSPIHPLVYAITNCHLLNISNYYYFLATISQEFRFRFVLFCLCVYSNCQIRDLYCIYGMEQPKSVYFFIW